MNRPAAVSARGPVPEPLVASQCIGPDDLYLARHRDIEAEMHAAYLDGFGAGLAEANRRMTEALEEAIAGPDGYGIEPGPSTARDTVRRMLTALGLAEQPPETREQYLARRREHDLRVIIRGDCIAGRHDRCTPATCREAGR